MATDASLEVYRKLEKTFHAAELHRPMRIQRYEVDTELEYDISDVASTNTGRVRLLVEKFVGGGFAGQVYRVKILDIEVDDGPIGDLAVGGVFAMKILIPPTGFSRLFIHSERCSCSSSQGRASLPSQTELYTAELPSFS